MPFRRHYQLGHYAAELSPMRQTVQASHFSSITWPDAAIVC
jgi:hypothetical protein